MMAEAVSTVEFDKRVEMARAANMEVIRADAASRILRQSDASGELSRSQRLERFATR